MENELIELRRRLIALEETLAAIQKESVPSKSRWGARGGPLSPAAMVLACVAIIVGARGGASVGAQSGPSKVVAPFLVVDGAGNHLFSVTKKGAASGGGGALRVFGNASSEEVILIAATDDGTTGDIQLKEKGQLLVDIVTTLGYGAIQLKGTKAFPSLELLGMGWVTARNASGKEVVHVGTDLKNNGELLVRNASEQNKVHLFVAPDGSGLVQLSKSQDQVSVHMGTKENGKGDVCAYGVTGQVCLSGLALKTFTPY